MNTAASTTGKLLEVRKGVWIVFLFFVLLVAAETPVFPAEDESGTNRPAERAPTKQEQGRVQLGAELRWRFEFRDNADLGPAEDFERFLGQRIRLHQHLGLLVGYSVLVPEGFAARTRGPELHHFGYIQTLLGF